MNALQEDITQKTLALCVEASKMTAQLLQQAMKKVLADMEKYKNDPQLRHGKQTLRQLIRSREISASIILQSQSQLKTTYKDAADTIVGNCDSTLFLGGKEKSTLKEISELLGKETIDSLSQSENRGAQTSHGLSYQKLGKELMTQDEIAVMDGGKCILQLRGVRPFFSDKFDITKHPRYRYLSDADKKNVFDVERYMKRRPAIVKPDEPFDMYELNASDLEPDNNNSTKRKEK